MGLDKKLGGAYYYVFPGAGFAWYNDTRYYVRETHSDAMVKDPIYRLINVWWFTPRAIGD